MMGRPIVLAAAVATAGTLALAPVATAQTEPPFAITAEGSTDGIDGHVQVTITKPAGEPVKCTVIGVEAGSTDLADDKREFQGTYTTSSTDPTWSWGFVPVADGDYDVHWGCIDNNDTVWGSFDNAAEGQKLEPVRDIHVSHDPNATVNVGGGQGSIDFGSLTSGSSDGGSLGS